MLCGSRNWKSGVFELQSILRPCPSPLRTKRVHKTQRKPMKSLIIQAATVNSAEIIFTVKNTHSAAETDVSYDAAVHLANNINYLYFVS